MTPGGTRVIKLVKAIFLLSSITHCLPSSHFLWLFNICELFQCGNVFFLFFSFIITYPVTGGELQKKKEREIEKRKKEIKVNVVILIMT
jgi:hypothetical protein